jgi:DNA-binding response OmpR family regulator
VSAEPPTIRRMLVVDDESRILDVIPDHFASRCDVDTATSATRAVEMFEHHRPDVVLLHIKGLTLMKFLLCSKVVLKPRR